MNLHNKKSSRSGRYRKQLISLENIKPIAQNLEDLFKELNSLRQASILNDAEFLSFGLLALLGCRRPDAFQKNPITKIEPAPKLVKQKKLLISDFLQLLKKYELPIHAFKKFTTIDYCVWGFLNHIRLRGIPDSAKNALTQWLNNQYPLTLFFRIPTVDEVFNLQKRGGRCVSFFLESKDMLQLYHGRDVISFIIHDLIHANEFYSNPERAQQQIGFYHWLDEIKSFPQLQNLLQSSEGFKDRWEYLLSDMNSYCGHLLKTLHAAITIYSHETEKHLPWLKIVENSQLTNSEKTLFARINSLDWTDEDFQALEIVFENKFKSQLRG